MERGDWRRGIYPGEAPASKLTFVWKTPEFQPLESGVIFMEGEFYVKHSENYRRDVILYGQHLLFAAVSLRQNHYGVRFPYGTCLSWCTVLGRTCISRCVKTVPVSGSRSECRHNGLSEWKIITKEHLFKSDSCDIIIEKMFLGLRLSLRR